MYRIVPAAVTHPESLTLIAALDAWQTQLYPSESNHLSDLSEAEEERLIFMVIRSPQGEAVGCGAVLITAPGFGELKRVYIDERHRGQRLGEALLAKLEQAAGVRGCHTLRLETGIKQPAAITLYQRCGYALTDAFPPYQPDPLSLFMRKNLTHSEAAAL